MKIKYDKLWDLMRANKMKKGQLAKAADISQYTMNKLYRDESVDLQILLNICKIFHCNIGDVVEFVENETIRREL